MRLRSRLVVFFSPDGPSVTSKCHDDLLSMTCFDNLDLRKGLFVNKKHDLVFNKKP